MRTQPTVALMSVRAATTAFIVAVLISFSSFIPDSPDKVQWLGFSWLGAYATAMVVQLAWWGGRSLLRQSR